MEKVMTFEPKNRGDVYEGVKQALCEALGCNENEVTLSVTLSELGASSVLDFIEINLRLELIFRIGIPRGELFIEQGFLFDDSEFMKDGVFTPAGVSKLKEILPHANWSVFEKDPRADKLSIVFTVQYLVDHISHRLNLP